METLGLLAATLTTTAFLPQAIRTIRTRDTSGISLTMYIVLEAGILLWIVYGVHFDLTPVWLGNVVTGLFAGVILVLKLRERPDTVPTPDT